MKYILVYPLSSVYPFIVKLSIVIKGVKGASLDQEDCVVIMIKIKERFGRDPARAGSRLATEAVFR